MTTTQILVDDSIPLVTLVRALASQGLAVRGDRKGGLVVTTVSRAARSEVPQPQYSVDGAGGATIPCRDCNGHGADPMSDNVNWLPCRTCHGTGAVANSVTDPQPAGKKRALATSTEARQGTEAGERGGRRSPDATLCHEHGYLTPCPRCRDEAEREDHRDGLTEEQILRADDDRQRAHDINLERRLLGL